MASPPSTPKQRPDLVLIDDDALMRSTWTMVGRTRGHVVWAFEGLETFSSSDLDPHTPIYIDYCLGRDGDGVDVAHELAKRGFKNLYLCTGMPIPQSVLPEQVRRVVGKDYPLPKKKLWTPEEVQPGPPEVPLKPAQP